MEIYERPKVEVIEVAIEAGFAVSYINYSTEEADYNGETL